MSAPVEPVASEEVEAMCAEAETWAKVKSGSQAALLKAVALLRKLDEENTTFLNSVRGTEVVIKRLEAERAQYQKKIERYAKALDDIYNHNEAARAAVVLHFGTLHDAAIAKEGE